MLPLHSNLWGWKYFIWEPSTKKSCASLKRYHISYKHLVNLIAWQLSLPLILPFHLFCLSRNFQWKNLSMHKSEGNSIMSFHIPITQIWQLWLVILAFPFLLFLFLSYFLFGCYVSLLKMDISKWNPMLLSHLSVTSLCHPISTPYAKFLKMKNVFLLWFCLNLDENKVHTLHLSVTTL